MITTAASALLHHQQSQFVLLAENTAAELFHLALTDVVNIHTNAGAHALRTLQRAVVVGQTRVVHLHQL